MEAPKIIWLSPNEYHSNEPSCFWSESQRTDYDIKYISKDSFIEKAEEFIYSALNDGIMGTANIEDFMRLFKNYMEGE